ncbi:Uncharacterised protein [Proteus mirabilis]|uniref:Uncharacterized protein n=1 Tax=Proteus mirabilis TaxID=584 RepID=A0A379GJA3_PROMI|nr:Uncharacterised protein [Proteus mirabilis]
MAYLFIKLAIALAVMSAVLVGMLWVMPDWQQGNMLMRILRLLLVLLLVPQVILSLYMLLDLDRSIFLYAHYNFIVKLAPH